MKILLMNKKCSCGRKATGIPETAKFSDCPDLGGFYWECVCGSTLWHPHQKQKSVTQSQEDETGPFENGMAA